MKRLRDIEPGSPLMEKAQSLLDAVQPVPESRERMARIRREIDRPRGALAGLRRLPALVLAALVALFGASAFAAVRYLAARPEPAAREAERSDAAPAKRAHHAGKRDEQPAPAVPVAEPLQPAAGPATEPAQAPAAQVTTPGTALHGGAALKGTAPRVAPRVERAEARAHGNDSALVHRALKALRRDGDPALAARLLEENRKRYPDGPLAEEALSLQIETALVLHDAHARAFAREYLSRYPEGRYLAVARRALEVATP